MLFLVQAWAPSANFDMSLTCSLVFGSRGVPKAGLAPQEHAAEPNEFLCSPFMPAGSGSCPSSASSGAVEAKCQQAAEAVQAGKMVLKTEAGAGKLSECDSDGIPSSAVPSDHSSAVPSDDDTPASSAVPSDHDSDVSQPPDRRLDFAISPLDFAVQELGPLLQDGDLKSCGCPRGCWQAIAEDEEALSLWRSVSDDFGQLKQLDEKQEADAFLLDMLKHCGPNGGPPPQMPRGSTDTIFYVGKVPVCKRALKMFLGIGTGRMDRLLAHARQGGVTPPVDGRVDGGLTKSPEWFDADSWFCWAYRNIAEFIATMPMKETSLKAIEDLVPELSDFTVDGNQCRRAHAARTDPSAPCHDVAQQLSDIKKLLVKFMHPASLATVYELYKKSCGWVRPLRGRACKWLGVV